ncbi:tyrosyl-DNA phosphodiesterase-domain-containing protein [Biscogniauxia marginata]|nr:tyrosyl-DNA phosphodiesterase-domain-containing protein [Biscogniauxia marginata]
MMDGPDPFNGDEEAALRYAIELSMQEAGMPQSASTSEKPTIVLSSDDEDDDLERGPTYPPTPKKAASPSNSPMKGRVGEEKNVKVTSSELQHVPSSSSSQPVSGAAAPNNGFSALGFDRKKMEEERLARIAKRKAPNSDQEAQNRRQRVKHGDEPTITSATTSSIATGTTIKPADSKASGPKAAKGQPPQGLPYPKGVVKKTWARGYPRQDDIKIEEVFQKDELELAVLSSFQWDEEWMLSKLDIRRTKIMCIAFASSEAQQEEIRNNVPQKLIRFCFPPMMPAGAMHSKLQLLKYPTYLRIVVPSGNLVPYDWGETGVMENMVFLIDLPRIEESAARSSNNLTNFGEELSYFLKAQGLDESLVGSLTNYDFSETSRFRFVHTIGQIHVDEWQRTGYCGLGRAVTSMGLNTSSEIELDFVVASLGSINMDLISALYNAAQGDNGLKEYERRTARGGKKKASADNGSLLKGKCRVYFPSHNTVIQSRGGKNAGGTICVQSKWWDSATFPREIVHDCKSVRRGLLVHSKVMFVRHSRAAKLKASWAYVGSANLSESAWGRLVKDKASGRPKLNCRNWECGVLIPVPAGDTAEESHHADLTAFQSIVPVPVEVPGEAYGASASKRPWLFLDN